PPPGPSRHAAFLSPRPYSTPPVAPPQPSRIQENGRLVAVWGMGRHRCGRLWFDRLTTRITGSAHPPPLLYPRSPLLLPRPELVEGRLGAPGGRHGSTSSPARITGGARYAPGTQRRDTSRLSSKEASKIGAARVACTC